MTPEARAERKAIVAFLLRLGDEQMTTARAAVHADPMMSAEARTRLGDYYSARQDGIHEACGLIRKGAHRTKVGASQRRGEAEP